MSKKISQMSEATEIKSGDISIIVQDGETKKFNLDLLPSKAQINQYKTDVENKLTTYEQEITDIKNQYDKELYTPEISVTNTSMVKTGQGDNVDYSVNVEDGVAKSAILKGQTLVNLVTTDTSSGYTLTNDGSGIKGNRLELIDGFDNKTYTIILELSNVNIVNTSGSWVVYISTLSVDGSGSDNTTIKSYIKNGKVAFNYKPARERKTTNNFSISLHTDSGEGSTITISNVVVLDGDYTNVDIPYFTGMQSVKMPVLTTTGKNLFNVSKLNGLHENIKMIPNGIRIKNMLINNISDCFAQSFKENTQYTFSFNHTQIEGTGREGFKINYTDGTYSNAIPLSNSLRVFSSLPGKTISSIGLTYTDIGVSELTNIQLEEGSTATSYEPFKSNILTVNEEIELRGIGEVQDTLDCLTGEIIESIGEGVLNGSEEWIFNTPKEQPNHWCFHNYQKLADEKLLISDRFPQSDIDGDRESIRGGGDFIFVYISKEKVEGNVNSFKQWLSQNPIKYQYRKSEKSVKTVVLNPSGALASETPYMWKNGSIKLSSDGLVPNLDYAVSTSRVGVIETNMQETIQNEKRIHSLEVILAQATVTSAYDTVSLQSDVETATMSLDNTETLTENKHDNFLYEMILLLIENNANDESLFDKVCTFYLYGKLSDEQFMNIYNLLYVNDGE